MARKKQMIEETKAIKAKEVADREIKGRKKRSKRRPDLRRRRGDTSPIFLWIHIPLKPEALHHRCWGRCLSNSKSF